MGRNAQSEDTMTTNESQENSKSQAGGDNGSPTHVKPADLRPEQQQETDRFVRRRPEIVRAIDQCFTKMSSLKLMMSAVDARIYMDEDARTILGLRKSLATQYDINMDGLKVEHDMMMNTGRPLRAIGITRSMMIIGEIHKAALNATDRA